MTYRKRNAGGTFTMIVEHPGEWNPAFALVYANYGFKCGDGFELSGR